MEDAHDDIWIKYEIRNELLGFILVIVNETFCNTRENKKFIVFRYAKYFCITLELK